MTIQQGQYCVVVFTSGIPGPQGSVGSITANQWHNLAFTYDGATGWGYGYIDGESYALPACNPVIGIPRPGKDPGRNKGGRKQLQERP